MSGESTAKPPIEPERFDSLDMRIGRVVEVRDFPEARRPAYRLTIDFGAELGMRRSSAQITHYEPADLQGRLVAAVVNLPPRQIGPFVSEVLVLGALDAERGVVLLDVEGEVGLGSRIG